MSWLFPAVALIPYGPPDPSPQPPVVREVRVTTAWGTRTDYVVTADAPVELRAAAKAREFADRDVHIAEQVQLLKLEAVQNERKLGWLRTAAIKEALTTGAGVPGPPANDGVYGGRGAVPGPLTRQLPGGDVLLPQMFGWSDGALKQAVAATLAQEASADQVRAALDRMVQAEKRLKEVGEQMKKLNGVNLHDPNIREQVRVKVNALIHQNTGATDQFVLNSHRLSELTDRAAARREKEAEKREKEAFARYKSAAADDKESARGEWEDARKDWDEAREVGEAVRKRLATDATLVSNVWARANAPGPQARRPAPATRPVPPPEPDYTSAPIPGWPAPQYGGSSRR